MKKTVFALLSLALLLASCGGEEASSTISIVSDTSDSSSTGWVKTSQPSDYIFTLFRTSLRKHLLQENIGYQISKIDDNPLLSFSVMNADKSNDKESSIDEETSTSYTIDISGNNNEIHSMNRSSADEYKLSAYFKNLNIGIQIDNSDPLQLRQSYGVYYAKVEEDYGFYFDLSKASTTVQLLSSLYAKDSSSSSDLNLDYLYLSENLYENYGLSLNSKLPLTTGLVEDNNLPGSIVSEFEEIYDLGYLDLYEDGESYRASFVLEDKEKFIEFSDALDASRNDSSSSRVVTSSSSDTEVIKNFFTSITIDFTSNGLSAISFQIDVGLDEKISNLRQFSLASKITPLPTDLAFDNSFPTDLSNKEKWVPVA